MVDVYKGAPVYFVNPATGDVYNPQPVYGVDPITGLVAQAPSNESIAAYLATATLAAGTLTTSQPMTLTQTWNNAGVNFTGLLVNITNTASGGSSKVFDFQVGGVSVFSMAPNAIITGSTLNLTASNAGVQLANDTGTYSIGVSSDVKLARDAAGVLAQRNGANAQAFRIYNTFTDASNYERALLAWSSNILQIGTDKAGTGASRAINFMIGGSAIWNILTTGHLVAATDAAYDIGASGATRPRDLFLSRNLTMGGDANLTGSIGIAVAPIASTYTRIHASTTSKSCINFGTGVAPSSPNDGDFWFDGTDFKARVGGATKTFTLV